MTKEVRTLTKKRNNLWNLNKRVHWRNAELKKEYDVINRELDRKTHEAVKEFEKAIIEKSKDNPKLVYSYMNSKQKTKSSIDELIGPDGSVKRNKGEIANSLNEYFGSVHSKEENDSLEYKKVTDAISPNIEITSSDIEKCLSRLDGAKSHGVDNVHPHVLKNCSMSLKAPLEIIFKKSLATGEVPNLWKKANITPIHKSGNKNVMSNYRPVSLTSVVCKIMEKIVKDNIMTHLIKHQLITRNQHGFVKNKNCTTNLLEAMDYITHAIAQGIPVDVFYADFAKAFDKVPHKKLIAKLKSYGINDKTVTWIQSFLADREQRVVLGKESSNWSRVTSGVPQGSVLGPLLFVIYINDLTKAIENRAGLYADDSKVFRTVENEVDRLSLQKDIDALVNWSFESGLPLNSMKCHVMHLGKNNRQFHYDFLDRPNGSRQIISTTNSEKDLGVIVSSDLKLDQHINKITTTANKMLGQILNTFTYIDQKSYRSLYCTFVRSQLEFAQPVWSPNMEMHIEKLERIQRRATKRAPGLANMDYGDRLEKLNLTSLEDRRTRGDLITQFKIMNGIEVVDWSHPPVRYGTTTRGHQFRYIKELSTNSIRSNFFNNRIAGTWNCLPKEVVDARSVNSFKARIDEWYEGNNNSWHKTN
jgi:hypothetical protein